MATGNLHIFGDSDKEEDKPKESKRLTKEMKGNEAKISFHFFQEELKEISAVGCVRRGPNMSLIVEYREDRAEEVEKLFKYLNDKIYSLSQKEVPIKEDKDNILDDFVRENGSKKDLLVIPGKYEVLIVGKTQGDVDIAAHQFKMKTGAIKPSGRLNRQNSESSEEKASYSAVAAKKPNNLYPNLDSIKNSKIADISVYDGSSHNKFSTSLRSSTNSSSGEFRFETTLKGGMLLKVYKASIIRVDVDAIVNAANDTMMHGGGVARVISEAAGYELDRESREYVDRQGQVKVSENIVTTAGRLRYKGVIHAVGPMWHDYRDKIRCLDDLYDCVWNILDTCKERRFRKVAMSAISAGIFAVPKELCADMYVYAAGRYSRSRSPTECPDELHIIDVDTSILQLVEQSVKRWEQNPESLNQRKTLPKYLKENPHQVGYSGGGGHGDQRSHGGHRARHHRGGGESQQSERRYRDGIHGNERSHRSPSPQSNYMEATYKIISSIKKLPDENLKWGGVAKRFIIDKQVTVKIYKGDITKMKQMDAIVCGTGTDLEPKGFISKALQKVGGYMYTSNYSKMKEKHKHCDPADVFKCKAGDLGAKFVLHVASNRLVDANAREMEAYKKCVDSVLKKAKRNDMATLAIPLFGTGQIQTNKRKLKLCGESCLKALDDFLQYYGDKHHIQEVHLVNNSTEVTDALEEVFTDALGETTKPKRNSGEYKRRDDHSSSLKSNSGPSQNEYEGRSSYNGRAPSAEGCKEFFSEEGYDRGSGSNTDNDDHYDQIRNVSDDSFASKPSPQPKQDEQKGEENKKGGNLLILDSDS